MLPPRIALGQGFVATGTPAIGAQPISNYVVAEKKGWIQQAKKSIEKRGTAGVCTGDKFGGPTCKPGSKRYNLAKTFKKMSHKKS